MTQFTKKLFQFGSSLAVVVPADIRYLFDLQKGDYVTIEVIKKEVKKK